MGRATDLRLSRDDAMSSRVSAVLAGVILVASAVPVRGDAETLQLRGGGQVVGVIIAEKPGAYFVDLGFDVIKVPRDQVEARRPVGAAPAANAGAVGPAAEAVPADNFFLARRLAARPVKDLVQDYGEAVISIETPSGLGSGFVVNDRGYAVTNHHVIDGETRITAIAYVESPGGLSRRRIEGVELVALNPLIDLALLRLPLPEDLKLRPAVLGSQDDLNAGDAVFAVGNPLGLERSVSQGILSTLKRNFDGLIFLQTDAAINPGNSGGPLFNSRGEVVGVTNMKASQGDNLGFAIPIQYVKDFLRNREAFAFDKDNPNTGYRYLDPPRRLRPEPPAGAVAPPGNGG
jgi:serine protease Do